MRFWVGRHCTDRGDSDLNLPEAALPGATLFDLCGLQIKMESLLGVGVDLVTPGEVSPKALARVLAEAKPV